MKRRVLARLHLKATIFFALLLSSLTAGAFHSHCLDLFKQDRFNRANLPHAFAKGKKDQNVPLFSQIDSTNFDQIFTHQYDPSKLEVFGAKAVAYSANGSTIYVTFFPTGEGTMGWNIHHRDVLSKIIEDDSNRRFEQLVGLEKSLTQSNAPPAVKKILNDQLDRLGTYDFDNIAQRIKKRVSYPDAEMASLALLQAQGFQLSAQKVNGYWKIIRLDIDSSITSFQSNQTIMPLSRGWHEDLLEQVEASIDPQFKKYPQPQFPVHIRWLEEYPLTNEGYYIVPGFGLFFPPPYVR